MVGRCINLEIDEQYIDAEHWQAKYFEVLYKGKKLNNAKGVVLKGVREVVDEKETITG